MKKTKMTSLRSNDEWVSCYAVCLSLALSFMMFWQQQKLEKRKNELALYFVVRFDSNTHTAYKYLPKKKNSARAIMCAFNLHTNTHTLSLTQTHWYVHCYIHMPYELHIIRRVRDSIIHAKRLRRCMFFCCFYVCACELVWSALKFVYISCLCVCVYASRQTKTTSSVIAHLNRFSTRFIWNCDTRTRNAHKHTSRALNSLTRLEKMKTRNFWENEWKWARWIWW